MSFLGCIFKINIFLQMKEGESFISGSDEGGRVEGRQKWSRELICEKVSQILSASETPVRTKDIYFQDGNLYSAIGRWYRAEDGSIDWESIIASLDPDLRDRLILPERRRGNFTDESAIATLCTMIDESDVLVTPLRVSESDNSLKRYLKKRFPSETGGTDWSRVIELLPLEYRARFSYRETRQRSWDQAIAELETLMRENRGYFSPSMIRGANMALYSYLSRRVKVEGSGAQDWSKVSSALSGDLRERFRFRPLVAEKKPIEEYPNATGEVESVIDSYRDDLFLFFLGKSEISQEQRERREGFCHQMIKLAQRGNPVAYQRLTELVMIMVNEWIDNDKDHFGKYVVRSGLAEDRVEACIKNYRFKGNFVGYVYTSLKMHALQFPEVEGYKEEYNTEDKD